MARPLAPFRCASWVALVCLAGCSTPPASQPFVVEVEGGVASFARNDVAVPGDTGTRFALDELTGAGPFPVGRLSLLWRSGERHEWRVLYAPLSVSGTDTLSQPVSFAGTDFSAGLPTEGSYRFDSYRLTYRYMVHDGERWDWRVGLTGNVRDAAIELEQDGTSASKTDTGFVPLLHFAGDYALAEAWRLSLDVDGAWAPQGRALDAALKAYWRFSERAELGLGYRTIEGGADNDEVYTFAWVNEAVLSLRFAF